MPSVEGAAIPAMDRVPEPEELMTDPAQARAYAEADFDEPHQHFVTLFRDRFPNVNMLGRVLDVGCGTADVTLRFARAFPFCRVDGVDGSLAMLRYARAAVSEAKLQSRITLLAGYLPRVSLSRERYDAVVSNSLLHHLHDPMVLWETVSAHAKRGAPLFVMDLTRPKDRAAAQGLVDRYAKDEPEILRRDFYNSLLASYRPDEVQAQLDAAGLSNLEIELPSDRHIIVWGEYGTGGS